MTRSPPLELVIILIGKTCPHRHFCDSSSSRHWTLLRPTIRTSIIKKIQTPVDGRKDTAGMEKFRLITPSLLGVHMVLYSTKLAYDTTDAASFYALSGWLSEIDCHVPLSIPKMIVGDKLDQARLHWPFLSQRHLPSLAATRGLAIGTFPQGIYLRSLRVKYLPPISHVVRSLMAGSTDLSEVSIHLNFSRPHPVVTPHRSSKVSDSQKQVRLERLK
ncbi:hypothetical protein BKA83DRAFT_4127858 [Pisolithus microcarpus]|nr:hypothetical protein BKA83DRAFT_4127858 [Pisolithus microcarpus]